MNLISDQFKSPTTTVGTFQISGLVYPRPPYIEKRHAKATRNLPSLSLCHFLTHGIHHSYLRFIHSIAAPPTTAASPPATAQSGDNIAPAADLVTAVLAELDVAVLLLELVAEEVTVRRQQIISHSLFVIMTRKWKMGLYVNL